MKLPPIPKDEELRIKALESYEVMDTSDEEAFDQITELVCKLLDVPIALISLIDSDRQWFKSKKGLQAAETPKEISFCGHAVFDKKTLVVNDASRDERFHDNPLVTGELGIRFYVGEPIVDSEGFALGTLCAIDREPRELSPDQMAILKLLALSVLTQLELRKKYQALLKKYDEMDEIYQLTKKFHDKSAYAIALVEIIPGGIWYISKNKAMDDYFSDVAPQFLREKFNEVIQSEAPYEFLLGQSGDEGNYKLQVTLKTVGKSPRGHPCCSLIALKVPVKS